MKTIIPYPIIFIFCFVIFTNCEKDIELINSGAYDVKTSPDFDSIAYNTNFSYVMGDGYYKYTKQKRPAQGIFFIDETFHTQIYRFTESSIEGIFQYGINNHDLFSYPESSDGNFLLFETNIYEYNYVLYSNSGQYLKILDGLSIQYGNPIWDGSGNYPTRLYYHKDMQLRYIDVSNNSDCLVRDFSNEYPFIDSTLFYLNCGDGASSTDSRYWILWTQKKSVENEEIIEIGNAKIFVYDKTLDSIIAVKVLNPEDQPVHVSMSLSGDYVYVAYKKTGKNDEFDGPHSYKKDFSNLQSMNINGSPDNSYQDVAPCFSKQGNEGMITCNEAMINFVRFDNGKFYYLYSTENMGNDGSYLFYTPTAKDKNGWVLVTSYSGSKMSEGGNNHWSDNQIFMMEIDETIADKPMQNTRIWRISFCQNEIGNKYVRQYPYAKMNRLGTKIWWGANWRNYEAKSEIYQCNLPKNWYSDLN